MFNVVVFSTKHVMFIYSILLLRHI